MSVAGKARSQNKVIDTSVCAVAKDPVAFDNKLVRLKATVVNSFEIFAVRDADRADCGSLWFAFPGGGPEASTSLSAMEPTVPRPEVHLRKNYEFNRFKKLLDAHMYPRSPKSSCIGCNRYQVTAIMVGLVEYADLQMGFGHLNGFPLQFVLQSVEQSSAKDLASNYDAKEFSATPIRFATGYLEGKLLGPDGQPIPDGDLEVYSTDDLSDNIDVEGDSSTNEVGRFRLAVPPGKYIIGFNIFWPPSQRFPFPPTYFPSTEQKSAARTLVVADRQTIGQLIFKIPRYLPPRTIPIKVVWPDGKPVADANVWLSQLSNPTGVVGISVSHTAADGTFDLSGLEGIDYIVHADKYAGVANVACAKNVLIRANDKLAGRIELPLARTAFDVCTNIDFEAPAKTEVKP